MAADRRRTGTNGTWLLAGLGAVACLLIYVNFRIADLQVDVAPLATSQPVTSNMTVPAESFAIDSPELQVADLKETTSRPIFFPLRRVPGSEPEPAASAAPAAVEAEVVAPPDALQLIGTMQIGNQYKALVRPAGGGEARWLAVGDEFGGWKVKQVMDDRILVMAAKTKSELRLFGKTADEPKTR